MECKQHCPCYIEAEKKRQEARKRGAKTTNKNYTRKQRREAAKKGWAKRRKRGKII